MTNKLKTKWAAANERFGEIAAVAPQQRQCEFGSYYPAASVVEAATTPSRRSLYAILGTAYHTETDF